MFTNKEIVARIKNQLKLLTKDDQVNDRFILYTAQNIATTYISQKLNDMSLYREDNLYTIIGCFDMVEEDSSKCGIHFKSCKTIFKSKNKLPKLIFSKFGSSLREVTSLDGTTIFKPSTSVKFKIDSKRNKGKELNKFYIQDGYLIIPERVKKVSLDILTLDLYDANELSECSDKCKSVWDYDFVCSDKLLKFVIDETVQSVLITKQIIEDETGNLNNQS